MNPFFRFVIKTTAMAVLLMAGAQLTLCDATAAESLAASSIGKAAVQLIDVSWRQPAGDWIAAKDVAISATNVSRFTVTSGDGIMVNGKEGRTVNLITQEEFGDVDVHIEFCIPKQSNSGVYFMGRYEVQVYDSFGVAKDKYPGIECGGIYPRWAQQGGEFEGHSPRINVSKPAGEWQSFDVLFSAPRFDGNGKKIRNARFRKVQHNGKVIHENVEVTGPTRAAHWEDEKTTGPLLLQGDHGAIAYRNLKIKKWNLKE